MIEQASLVIGEGNWAVKSDSLLGYKINGGKYYPREMSVVRATTGTRINEDGLVELVPYNLATYSEEINNWGQERTSVITNATTAPNGTLTADKLITDSTPNTTHQAYNGAFTANIGTLVISGYFKKGEYNLVHLGTSASAQKAWFDLDNGVVGNYNAEILSASIENVGDGWYRCVAVVNNSSASIYVEFGPANVDGSRTILGTPSGGIFAWGIQYVEGSSALDYLPTTDRLDVARIDYSSGSGALLIEPQRTNLALYSSSFDNAYWDEVGTITENAGTAPDGTLTADKLAAGTSNLVRRTFTTISGATYTGSFYVKSANAGQSASLRFNISIGQATPAVSVSITTTDQWQRIEATYTTTDTITFFQIGEWSSFGYGPTNDILIWGAQMELGSYPTSLIPTQAATVTRNADVISKTGINNAIIPNSNSFTFFFDVVLNGNDPNDDKIQLNDSTANNRLFIYLNTLGITNWNNTVSLALNTQNKVAVRKNNATSVSVFVNGSLATTITPSGSNVWNPDTLRFLGANGSFYTNAAAIWDTALTDTECQTLTTI